MRFVNLQVDQAGLCLANKPPVGPNPTGNCLERAMDRPLSDRRYPTIYEKVVPITLVVICVTIVALLLITVAVVAGFI